MKLSWAMVSVAAVAMFSVPTMAQAFECPKLFVKAETAICAFAPFTSAAYLCLSNSIP